MIVQEIYKKTPTLSDIQINTLINYKESKNINSDSYDLIKLLCKYYRENKIENKI